MPELSVDVKRLDTVKIDPLAYYAHHSCALFPIPAGFKEDPGWKDGTGIIKHFSKDWNRDPAQWNAWRVAHPNCNFGLVSGASKLIIADIDVAEVGEQTAWTHWCNWWQSRGLTVPMPQVRSARGGWHALFACEDSSKLRQVPLIGAIEGICKKPIVDMRIGNGYVVAAGSYYDGTAEGKASGHYQLLSDAAPHVAPSALTEAVSRHVRSNTAIAAGRADPRDTARVLEWMAENNSFDSYERWYQCGMILRSEFGDDPGFALWQITNDGSVSAEQEAAKWQSFAASATAENIKIGTLRKWAKDDGCSHLIGVSATKMFGSIDASKVQGMPPLPALQAPSIAPEQPEAALTAPQPFVWRDPRTIPLMPWLYGTHLLRGCVSLTVAAPGAGKTLLKIMETTALVTGLTLLHDTPKGKLRVWFYNGEEPMDILERRFHAAFIRHRVTPEHLGDRLFVNDRTTKMIIARQTRDGVTIMEPVKEALIKYIHANQIDVLSIDPFVSAHAVTENDNVAIDQVVKAYADVAQITGCAIDLVHHARKTNGGAVTIEDTRGASAAIGAARAARVLNFMTEEEAEKATVANRLQYIRVDDAKPNHAPRADKAQWVQLQGVHLGNGGMGMGGDNVGVVVPWQWPDPSKGDPAARQARTDEIFLKLLDEYNATPGANLSAAPSAHNYAPKMFKKDPSAVGFTLVELKEAMKRLRDGGQIEVAPYGPPSKGTYRLQRNGMHGIVPKAL